MFSACAGNGGSEQEGDADGNPAETDAATLADGLIITDIFSYSGAYVEDGKNAACENICAVRLYNGSANHYQYLRFTVETADGVIYSFSASTLFANARMTVLSEDKTPYTGEALAASTLLNTAEFAFTPTVHLETVQISLTDGFINVKNLTEAALTNVFVYYKTTDDDGFFGGITYRASLGDIPAGELVQQQAVNIRAETSKVVFVTYDE